MLLQIGIQKSALLTLYWLRQNVLEIAQHIVSCLFTIFLKICHSSNERATKFFTYLLICDQNFCNYSKLPLQQIWRTLLQIRLCQTSLSQHQNPWRFYMIVIITTLKSVRPKPIFKTTTFITSLFQLKLSLVEKKWV